MKKILVLPLVLLLLCSQTAVYAISPTPEDDEVSTITPKTTPKETPAQTQKDTIQKIKDMVAKRVSQLNLVEKRGILGTVKDVSTTQVTVDDRTKTQRVIDIDELTKFQDNSDDDEEFGISDIKKGDVLAFVGLFNKDTKRLLARFVTRTSSIPLYFDGVVLEKDTKNFQLKVVNSKGTERTIDNQTSTKIQVHDKDGAAKSGFSKIEPGQRILAIGFNDTKNSKLFIPSRLIHFVDVPPSAEMMRFAGSEETPVSSGSGKKIQPLSR